MRQIKTVKKEKPITYTYSFKINHSANLLEFLLTKVKASRNTVKHLLGEHKVLVNGNVITQFDYPLAKDDEVKIAKESIKQPRIKKDDKPVINPIKKMIIYEDLDFLAINKPSGLLSIESDKEKECAYTYAIQYLSKKSPKDRPYILHRIDKDTSGVLVFSKNIKYHSMLKTHWNDDIELREYYAIVSGKLDKKKDTIISYLKENQNNLVYVSNDPHGKKAITHYEVIKENKNYSLLKVVIDTGRKNQIRVQLAHLGHPVIGDEKYGNGDNPINRLGLHASRLDFVHPETKEVVSLIAPLPKEFNSLL